ncbi:Thp2p Ecym_5093 [Eremothecium cymbalariae DBVPG|uniref:Uncharacterized protein n=1 Tax=Eremothecium cymbalariae (strain CBS 270.75 / DBVPG 7215 / KCTC 17166 / NRRL Y-17582) TaxID=931890 RepID=I6NCT5_ERECY|nr:hypothetical protein Ecym_5093 [Eremothecium cymbalariae DBVPG\
MSTRYMDLLNVQQGYLDENYNKVQEILDILDGLVDENLSDEEKVKLLKSLSDERSRLFKSLINLRVNNTNCIETYNTKIKIGPASDIAKSRLKATPTDISSGDNLFNYLKEVRQLHIAWLKHLKLLNALAVDMCYPLVNQEDTENIAVNKEHYPRELAPVLEEYDAYGADIEDIRNLRSKLMQYFENIKSSRAKYLLENKYLLADSLKELTKLVAAWSQKWEHLENILFGDSPASLRKLLQTMETVKASLPGEQNEDVVMG